MTGNRAWARTLLGFAVVGAVSALVFPRSLPEASFALVFMCYGVTGWLIARAHPDNTVGWLLLAFAAVGGLNGPVWAWAAMAGATGLPGRELPLWTDTWLWAPMLGLAFGPLLVYFPDGQLMSPRWRVVLWLSATFVLLAGVGNALLPSTSDSGDANPYALHGWDSTLELLTAAGGIALMLSLILGVSALVIRFRSGDATQRRQLKWFLLAALFLPVATIAGETHNQVLQGIVIPLALALQAAAIGIAILRHGLYDIDRIISRTLSWGLVTLVIGGVYLALVTILTSFTSALAGDSPFAVAVATLCAAAAFGPVRRRIQLGVDRRFNRARYDAARTAEAYRMRLRDQLELEAIQDDLVRTVGAAVQPTAALVWLRAPEVRL